MKPTADAGTDISNVRFDESIGIDDSASGPNGPPGEPQLSSRDEPDGDTSDSPGTGLAEPFPAVGDGYAPQQFSASPAASVH